MESPALSTWLDYTTFIPEENITVEVAPLPNAKVFLAAIRDENGRNLAIFGESGPNFDCYVHETAPGVSLDFVRRIAYRIIRDNRKIVKPA